MCFGDIFFFKIFEMLLRCFKIFLFYIKNQYDYQKDIYVGNIKELSEMDIFYNGKKEIFYCLEIFYEYNVYMVFLRVYFETWVFIVLKY